MTLFNVSYVLLWILALLLGAVSLILLFLFAKYEHGSRIAPHSDRSLVGTKLPDFAGTDVATGASVKIAKWRGVRHVLLAVSPDCSHCRTLLRALAPAYGESQSRIVTLCIGSEVACSGSAIGSASVPLVRLEAAAGIRFAMTGLPAALLVDKDGVVLDVRHPTSASDVVGLLENVSIVSGRESFSKPARSAEA